MLSKVVGSLCKIMSRTYILSLVTCFFTVWLRFGTSLPHYTCDENLVCDQWKLTSSWTQGGYEAVCSAEDRIGSIIALGIYIVRNVYNCPSSAGNIFKITNSYSDTHGKLCHLVNGEAACPGLHNASSKVSDNIMRLNLRCGEFSCKLQYHRCEVCPMVPWYSRLSVKNHQRIGCEKQLQCMKNVAAAEKCLRCDGTSVSKKFCRESAGGRYFVDVAGSKPSLTPWYRASKCILTHNTVVTCGNFTIKGKMTWKRHCQYSRNKLVRLSPKYCGLTAENLILTKECSVKAPLCITSKNRSTGKSKPNYGWIAIIIVAVFALVISLICLLAKLHQMRSGESGSLATGFFSSCATQTSPSYSPRRIISEPEYALVGNWRQNVVHRPQPECNHSYGENVYWGIEFVDLSDDDLADGQEVVKSANSDNSDPRSERRECCELNADSNRALYAKVNKDGKR